MTQPNKTSYSITPENIPEELKSLGQWVNWAGIWNEDKTKLGKPPMKANGRNASSTAEKTWTTFEKSLAAVGREGVYVDYTGKKNQVTLDGVGLAGLERTPFTGVDLDHCLNPDTGEINPAALKIVETFDSYTEITPSGSGLRIWIEAEKSLAWSANFTGVTDIEIYSSGRFFTVTGNHHAGTPRTIEGRQEVLDAFMIEYAPPKRNGEGSAERNGKSEWKPAYVGAEDQVLDLDRFLEEFDVRVLKQTPDGTADRAYYIVCPWGHDHTGGDTSGTKVGQYSSGGLWFKCHHGHCDGRGWEDFREELDPAAYRNFEITVGGQNGGGKSSDDPERFNLTDLGNAERFTAQHKRDVRYCYPWGKWLIWSGSKWERDDAGRVHRLAKETVRSIYGEASRALDEDQRKALAKHAAGSEAKNRIEAMLDLAKSDVPVCPDELDAKPDLLNVSNGTVDLRTGELREHRREDLLTKIAGAEYVPTSGAPAWDAFLKRVLPGDELRRFVQRAVGYSATGDTSEQVLFINHGVGANGKSTFQEALSEALGDYSMRAPSEMLMTKRSGGVPNDVARLKGARFVSASETEQGRHLAESLVKDLTGQDTISARFMRAEWFDFEPTHKLWLSTNHKPLVRGTDLAIWRRIRLVPWAVTIPPEEQDRRLSSRIRDELPGVLSWIVRGCLDWRREGLAVPAEVQKATGDYRSEMDTLGDFLEERCVEDPDTSVAFNNLWKAYRQWCTEAEEKGEPKKQFGMSLTERGLVAHKGRQGVRIRRGLRLKEGFEPDPGQGNAEGVADAPTCATKGITRKQPQSAEGVAHGGADLRINTTKYSLREGYVKTEPPAPPAPPPADQNGRTLTADEDREVQKLIADGMAPEWARAAVLGDKQDTPASAYAKPGETVDLEDCKKRRSQDEEDWGEV